MNLRELRIQLVKLTGRRNLIVDVVNYADAGANYYINMGQRWLDDQINTPQTEAKHLVQMAPRAFFIAVRLSKAIKSVSLVSSTDCRTEFRYLPPTEFRRIHPHLYSAVSTFHQPPFLNVGNSTAGPTRHFTLMSVRLSPDLAQAFASYTIPSGMVLGGAGSMVGNIGQYTGIVLGPSSDSAQVVEVVGDFYSVPLVEDYDVSYWSEMYPDLLLDAARYRIELDYRNSEGAKDMLNGMMPTLRGIDFNMVEQEIAFDDRQENPRVPRRAYDTYW